MKNNELKVVVVNKMSTGEKALYMLAGAGVLYMVCYAANKIIELSEKEEVEEQ